MITNCTLEKREGYNSLETDQIRQYKITLVRATKHDTIRGVQNVRIYLSLDLLFPFQSYYIQKNGMPIPSDIKNTKLWVLFWGLGVIFVKDLNAARLPGEAARALLMTAGSIKCINFIQTSNMYYCVMDSTSSDMVTEKINILQFLYSWLSLSNSNIWFAIHFLRVLNTHGKQNLRKTKGFLFQRNALDLVHHQQ